MMKFSGEKWELFGPIIDGHAEVGSVSASPARKDASRLASTGAPSKG